MIQRVHKKTTLLFKESFVPVLMVAAGLAFVLVYTNFKADLDADKIETIVILSDSEQGALEDSDFSFQEADVDTSGARKSTPLYTKARSAIKNKNWSGAEKIYNEIIAKDPESQAYSDLGVLYYNQNNYTKSLEQFDIALKLPPVYIGTYINRALVYTKINKLQKAVSDYRLVITKIPYHYQAHMNLGVVQIKTKEYSEAIINLKKASKLAGGSRKAKALFNLGIAYRSSGNNIAEAKKSFLAAIRIKPDYVEARFSLASLEPDTTAGRAEAIMQYNKVLELLPNYPRAYFHIAQIKSAEKDQQAAQYAYEMAVHYDPNYHKARYNLGLSYLSSKRWVDATNQFKIILGNEDNNQDYDDAKIHFQLGRSAYGNKDYETALAEYVEAVKLKSGKYEKALLNAGLTYKKLKEYKKAISTYKQVLELNVEYPQAWYNLGLAYLQSREYEKSEESLNNAIKYKSDYAQAWFNLGVIYRKQNKFSESINAYKNALRIKPDYRKAKLNLAVRYAKNGQYQQAIKIYKEVLEKDDRYAIAWINLGIAQFNTMDYSSSRISLERVLELQPENITAKQYQSRILILDNEYEQAIKLLREAVDSKENDAQLRLELGQAYHRAGEKNNAVAELMKGLRLDPDNQGIKEMIKAIMTTTQ